MFSRKDSYPNCCKIAELAKKFDAPISVGSDAHNAWDLGKFDKAVALISQYDFPAERIINNTTDSLFYYLKTKGIDIQEQFEW
ncbi:histidinol phosphatase [Vibrio ishigakensis]|uniref:Histidinol phosphatase n=1 Tax=Vibrio ishigakensis TaxID=1481914 RepID=A0A0B8QHS1_9VIBR|nr:histidinol phosphatase [Vibrio ishigakensis]